MDSGYVLKRMQRLLQPEASGIERFVHAVTYQCNSRCTMCNIWKIDYRDGVLRSQELTVADLERIFSDRELFMHVADIGLTGGEPMLHPQIVEITRFYLQRFPHARISLNTNALQPEKCVHNLKQMLEGEADPTRLRISFSLDGIGSVHDTIRGIPGNYEKVLKNLNLVRDAINGIELAFTMTVLPANYDQIQKVWELATREGVGFSFSFPQTSGSFYHNEEQQFQFSEEMLAAVERQVVHIQAHASSFSNFYYDGMVGYQRDPHEIVRCYAGRSSFFMDPTGNIYSCILLDKPFGNVKEKAFREVWESDQADEVRRWIWNTHCNCWGCESEVSFRRSWKVAVHGLKQKALSVIHGK